MSVSSDILEPLASHHYILISEIMVELPLQTQNRMTNKLDFSILRDRVHANRFATVFDDQMDMFEHAAPSDALDVDMQCARLDDAFHAAASVCLPERAVRANRPWISNGTLELLEKRLEARRARDYDSERTLTKRIKANVKRDRSQWLDDALATGDWAEVRKLRRGRKLQQGSLKNAQGVLGATEERAETLADYYESVQWADRPCPGQAYTELLGPELPVLQGPISYDEMNAAGRTLKYGKASGSDGIPAESWKAVLTDGSPSCMWVVNFMNGLLNEERVPSQWHEARVVAIYKKGDPTEASNYRPISLLQIGYKLFAQIILQRLKEAGAEKRIWPTQFGFKSGCGTAEALFLARRIIDKAWMLESGGTILMALDWAKAFDSISPAALRVCLQRFGLPAKFLSIISAIYADRRFTVRDTGRESSAKQQKFGVSQGCPLSPFLFSCLMTVLMHDARRLLSEAGTQLSGRLVCHEILYADDTLIIDTDKDVVHEFMTAISDVGQTLGLTLNWAKVETLAIRTEASIRAPSGEQIAQKESIQYLGATLAADGKIHHELARRIGAATADFKTLQKVWNHSTLNIRRKLRLFEAYVTSKVTYNLHVAWLNKSERRRLDGFCCRCLRRIMHIPSAFHSRVSNDEVFRRARVRPLSQVLLDRQSNYLHKLANLPNDSQLRASIFVPGSFHLSSPDGGRRVGRPRAEWGERVWRAALEVTGGEATLRQFLIGNASTWRNKVAKRLVG